jgi:hypothetical protein
VRVKDPDPMTTSGDSTREAAGTNEKGPCFEETSRRLEVKRLAPKEKARCTDKTGVRMTEHALRGDETRLGVEEKAVGRDATGRGVWRKGLGKKEKGLLRLKKVL